MQTVLESEDCIVMKLRPYQLEAVAGIVASLRDYGSALLVLPTGLGKTVVFSHAAKMARGRVLVLAHRAELIYQAAEKIEKITGEKPAIDMGKWKADEHEWFRANVVVSTVQTAIKRHKRFNPNDFTLVIIDEAHRSAAASYRRVLTHFKQNPKLKVLGVTATPDRQDQQALGQVFETVAYQLGIHEAIDDGWLVPIRASMQYVDDIDYSNVKTTAGDLNLGELSQVMEAEKTLHAIASPTVEKCGNRRAIIFAASVKQADALAEIINRYKPGTAASLDGKTPTERRKAILREFGVGKIQFLVNVGVLTEGFDDPGIEVVVMARPTKSRSLYAQCIGRGTRTLAGVVDGIDDADGRKLAIADSGKPFVEVMDFVGNSGKHSLVSTADILGGEYSDDVRKLAVENAQKSEGPVDMDEELEKAEETIRVADERKKHIKAQTTFRSVEVDVFGKNFEAAPRERGYDHKTYATPAQINSMVRQGVGSIDDCKKMSKNQASAILGELGRRREQGLCTLKQKKALKKFGIDATKMSFKEASRELDARFSKRKVMA